MKPTIFLALFATIAMFAACNKCKKNDEYHYLDASEKLLYKPGDKVVYKSSAQDKDTFTVSVEQKFDYVVYRGCETKGKGDYYEYYNYSYVNQKHSNYFNLHVAVNFTKYSVVWNKYGFLEPAIYPSLTLDGKTYSNVHYNINNNASDAKDIVKLYANVPYGVIWYQYKDSTTWSIDR